MTMRRHFHASPTSAACFEAAPTGVGVVACDVIGNMQVIPFHELAPEGLSHVMLVGYAIMLYTSYPYTKAAKR